MPPIVVDQVLEIASSFFHFSRTLFLIVGIAIPLSCYAQIDSTYLLLRETQAFLLYHIVNFVVTMVVDRFSHQRGYVRVMLIPESLDRNLRRNLERIYFVATKYILS